MLRYLATFILILLFVYQGFAQSDSLINSGHQLTKAKTLSDSGLYDLAISELKKIDHRDTNYIQSLVDLADAYYAMEKYPDAIETTLLGLLKPSPYRSELMVTAGMAYTQNQEYDKAVTMFDEGIKAYPFYPGFLLQKGKMYYSKKEYQEAEKYFFKALHHSPFNSISHLNLAIISMLRGEKVHGMMSMGIYLAINNSNNNQLVLLERFVKNEITDEFSIAASEYNSFQREDGIIRSRIAMDEAYKTRIPINAGIVRQYQVMFDQIANKIYDPNDPWVKYYLPIYKKIIDSNTQDAFIYHILKSSSIKQVPEWTKKNEKTLSQFYDVVNTTMNQWREKKILPELGYKNEVSCWYDDNYKLESIGNKNEQDKPVGLWNYFHQNGELKARGEYDKIGNKLGLWKYYNDSGIRTSTEDFETGIRERFTEDGKPWQRYYLLNDKIEGEVFIYYECGAVNEHLLYKNSLRHGAGEVFAPDGVILEKFTYQHDSLHGKYESFYYTGEKQLVSNYDKGVLQGAFTRYHRNGKVYSEGAYKNGKAVGKWTFYHDNGKPSEIGTYTDDDPVGEFRYFDRKGRLTEVRNYNEEGNIDGDNIFYHDGLLHYKMNNQNGRLIATTYYDLQGKELATYKEINGVLQGKSHFNTGEVRSEFIFQDGKATGKWKYFTRAGNIESEYEYKADEINGTVIEYHPNKQIKVKLQYEDGQKHGPYYEYYPNGKIKAHGWYQYGKTQQRWVYYHPNEVVRSDEYYLNDVQLGKSYYYSQEGKLFIQDEAKNDQLLDYRIFDLKGNLVSKTTADKNTLKVSSAYQSGQVNQQIEILCGKLTGYNPLYFSDGKVFRSRQYRNGKLNGPLIRNGVFGEPMNTGTYVDGSTQGKMVWYYPNGKTETVGNYFNDERDSVFTYYYEDGKVSRLNEYENGKRHGSHKIFGPEGDLLIEKKYDNGDLISYRIAGNSETPWIAFTGNGTIKVTYPDGKTALEEHYENGFLHGAEKLYYKNGKLFIHFNYSHGDYVGPQLTYYPDGKIRSRKNYQMDEEHGTFEWFDSAGKLERVENYEFGYLQGVSSIFKDGKRIKDINFWYGLPQE